MEKEVEEKFEKFKQKPLEYLEKFVFCNLTKTDDIQATIKLTELLFEVEKVKEGF